MSLPRTDLFEAGYNKFADFVQARELIPANRNRVVVAYSGGKDASLLADFLLEYRERTRPDIALELVNVVFPRFIYEPDDPRRRSVVVEALNFWRERGFTCTRVDAGDAFPDSLLDGDNPCQRCALFVKPKLFGVQLQKSEYKDAVFCIGLTLDDAVGWFIELLLLSAGRGDWRIAKRENPDLFALIMRLSIRTTCRLGIEKNNLLYSRPLMAFTDDEIRSIVRERGLPLIPEDCREQRGRNEFVDSPRRELGAVLSTMRRKYPDGSGLGELAIFRNYDKAMEYFERSGLLPGLEEREQYLNDTL